MPSAFARLANGHIRSKKACKEQELRTMPISKPRKVDSRGGHARRLKAKGRVYGVHQRGERAWKVTKG